MKQSYTERKSDLQASAKKPKVMMYFTYADRIGGPLTYINTIINSELKEKYDFSTCFQNRAPKGWNSEMLKEMIAAIKKENPDIVHVHGVQSEGFYGVLAARKAGVKHIVMTVHGFAFDDHNCRGIKHFLYENIIEPYSIRKSSTVYCVCDFASNRKIVKNNAGKRNYGYIYNCVPEPTVQESRKDIRSRYNLSDDDVVFCISGRVTRQKGFDILEEVVRILNKRETNNFKLMVLGNGTYFDTFTKNLKNEVESGQVIMIGQTDRVSDYLAACDAFIFPSYHENLSIALLEAGASGLPCIVSKVGGNPEVIKEGETGFVIDGFDPKEYAEKAAYLISNTEERLQIGKNIREDVLDRFSLHHMCEKIDEVYSLELGK